MLDWLKKIFGGKTENQDETRADEASASAEGQIGETENQAEPQTEEAHNQGAEDPLSETSSMGTETGEETKTGSEENSPDMTGSSEQSEEED